MIEDKILILKFKLGNRDALRRIYEKYKNDLLKLAVALTNDVNIAEDVVQDVFVGLAQSAGTIKPNGSLKRFLMTCTANRIRNLKRDQMRHQVSDIDAVDGLMAAQRLPEQWILLSEELTRLSSAMVQLPQEQREVVGLYMQGNMTFRQIAEVQQASINTVQGRYRYALNKLRSLLNHELDQ